MPAPITIDFETEAIEGRPTYPPRPVGVAIQTEKKLEYLAWGHPEKNNCDLSTAKKKLVDIWKGKSPILFHNAKFDLDVAETHFGVPRLPWERVHDTLFLLFLQNPHARSLSLKPSAEEYLGLPPTERDEVFEWLKTHRFIRDVDQKNAGANICKAPGDLVGKYAMGDVARTYGLWNKLLPMIEEQGMLKAYNRERQLLPILLDNERAGIRVDVNRLEADLKVYEAALLKAERWLRTRLRTPGLDFEKDRDVAKALKAAGVVEKFPLTPTGLDSVSKKNLTEEFFSDRKVWLALYYRNALQTVLAMSMRPWLEQATQNKNYIFTEWNQVRQSHTERDTKGARSGRITCSRFQNITKDFYDKGDGFEHPKFLGVPELPLVRKYLLPDAGDLFVHRDYNQQELRILAHFEDGALCRAYNETPDLDVHQWVRDLIEKVARLELERRPVKILNFRTFYGGGIGGFAEAIRSDIETARKIVYAHRRALPDVTALDKALKHLFRTGEPLRTWGGRLYRCEPPAVAKKGKNKGRWMTFEYKALNYLIQPSAADITKEAIIRYHQHPKKRGRMLVTVHDEINVSASRKIAMQESKILAEAMESIEIDVPWRTDGKIGEAWGELKKLEVAA